MSYILRTTAKQIEFLMKSKTKAFKVTDHPDFPKIANIVKDEAVNRAFALGLDIIHTGIYRLFDVGSFCLPSCPENMSVLDHAFDILFIVRALFEELNMSCDHHIYGRKSTATTSNRQTFVIMNHLVHQEETRFR